MSYSIYIGQAVIIKRNPKDYDGELKADFIVKSHEELGAPVFENDTMTGNSNSRHPGYGAWDDFATSTGLHDFFFDKEKGLMRQHPGCFKLTKKHAKIVSKALADYQAKYPKAQPGFAKQFMANSGIVMSNSRTMGAPDETVAEYHLARLMWLNWWVQWAIKNCKRPAIYNH